MQSFLAIHLPNKIICIIFAIIMNNNQILRAQWHDYREPGFYMLTLTTEGRMQAFGRLVGVSMSDANISLSPIGSAVDSAICSIPKYHSEVEIIQYVVMPDHCHICLHVKSPMKHHLGNVVRGLKSVSTKAYLQELDKQYGGHHILNRDLSQGKAKQQRQITSTQSHSSSRPTEANFVPGSTSAGIALAPPLWAEGYHDRIVTSRGQIARQRAYILRNPARLWLKRNSDRAYTSVYDLRIPLPMEKALFLKNAAIDWDKRRDVLHSSFLNRKDGKHYAETYLELTQHFLRCRQTYCRQQPFLRLRACGNRDLLVSGRPLCRVRLSRSITQEQFHAEAERLLSLCEHEGAILVSPFRSWSEKLLLHLARLNGYAHIIIYGESMSDVWKPQDGSFCTQKQTLPDWAKPLFTPDDISDIDLCYEGSLLYLAPWPDRPRSEHPAKADCEIMNTLASVLAETEIESLE